MSQSCINSVHEPYSITVRITYVVYRTYRHVKLSNTAFTYQKITESSRRQCQCSQFPLMLRNVQNPLYLRRNLIVISLLLTLRGSRDVYSDE